MNLIYRFVRLLDSRNVLASIYSCPFFKRVILSKMSRERGKDSINFVEMVKF